MKYHELLMDEYSGSFYFTWLSEDYKLDLQKPGKQCLYL